MAIVFLHHVELIHGDPHDYVAKVPKVANTSDERFFDAQNYFSATLSPFLIVAHGLH